MDELQDIGVTHVRRDDIGQLLHDLGDPRPGVGLREDGLPDIEWCLVDAPEGLRGKAVAFEGNKAKFCAFNTESFHPVEFGVFKVEPFSIAKYPITHAQFQAFVEHPTGFANQAWWRGIGSINVAPKSPRQPQQQLPSR